MPNPLSGPLAERLRAEVPLARYTAARLGGPAEWLYSARESRAELVAVMRHAHESELPLRVLGGGANVLIADEGLRGLVLINHVQEFEFGEAWLRASAGSGLMALSRNCQARGLSGLEWAVSVPGTLGGAVINNAGAHGGDMAGLLRQALLLEADGKLRTMTAAELDYDYRHSSLKVRADRDWLLLEATLALQPDDPARVAARMATFSASAQAQPAARRQPRQHLSQSPGRLCGPPHRGQRPEGLPQRRGAGLHAACQLLYQPGPRDHR